MDVYDYKHMRLGQAIEEAVKETDFDAAAASMNASPKSDFGLRKQFSALVAAKLEKDPRCFYCAGSDRVVGKVWMQHTWAALHRLWGK